MNSNSFFVLLYLVTCVEAKGVNKNNVEAIRKSYEEHQSHILLNKSRAKSQNVSFKITNETNIKVKDTISKKPIDMPRIISREQIKKWAHEVHEHLYEIERKIVRRDVLTKGFSDIKIELRNGTNILEKAAKALEELLDRRVKAAETIMRRAEELSAYNLKNKIQAPLNYTFDHSVDLDVLKKAQPTESMWEMATSCKSLNKIKLQSSSHFNARVSLETSSVHVVAEVFACDPRVQQHLYWSEGLLATFRENYAQDATLDFQYMCSAKGFLRHYPAALWQSLYNLNVEAEDVYDCRLRPWYVSASGAPRDVLILLDASGSMDNSSNQVIAEIFTSTLLNALTDDDQVNVLRFHLVVESPINCFNEKLVPANHVNSAAMMSALKLQKMVNESLIGDALAYAVQLLKKQKNLKRPQACQQAIVLVTDSLYYNYTTLMRQLDPEGRIRLFVMWLHDLNGLRDYTRLYGDAVSCERDGYFAEFITHSDVTEQVIKILRVLERPLVAQRKKRLRVYSDVYANIEDPRRGEFHWEQKESAEQVYRYKQLRRNKEKFLKDVSNNESNMFNLDKKGQYFEGENINYRLQISVAVPVFESTTVENITIMLDEEKQRNSTRTYPVNRLLGVAGVDIPLDHLKLILPYYLLGAGGSLCLLDHRGNVVLHNSTKPVFDGDILRPGYRTVDFLDVEQSAIDHYARHYPQEWIDFRTALVIDKAKSYRSMYAKSIYDGGMRVMLEMRDYHWQRVHDHYTLIVSLPTYNLYHAAPGGQLTQKLGEQAVKALSGTDFSVHPDWLYCRHIEPRFDSRELEVLHFLRRRRDEPNFAMQKLKNLFSHKAPTLFEKTYHCNEELMARLSHEAIITRRWSLEHEGREQDCATCRLGSITAFFASESGLTRWHVYHAASSHAAPVEGGVWARGPLEAWYRRASAAPDTLVVHTPVPPVGEMRNTDVKPPPLGPQWQWFTAARTVPHPAKQGTIGVAGYHFHPKHLDDFLESVTNAHCNHEDEFQCEPQCDHINWSCVLIDDAGWIVSDQTNSNDRRKHLATEHPVVMKALLNESVFKVRWVHDYQGVCFPPKDEKLKAAATRLPSIIMSLWSSIKTIVYASQNMINFMSLLTTGAKAIGDTKLEREKRRKRLQRDFEREKYEQLFDERVLIDRTRVATCDRSRPIYELQRNKKAMETLNRPANPCQWPFVATEVPETNLVLIAVYLHCPYTGPSLDDSLVNQPVQMHEVSSLRGSASRLACWRVRVPLPARPPRAACYPHNYTAEAGYRQCGPWLPDPENKGNSTPLAHLVFYLIIIIHLIII